MSDFERIYQIDPLREAEDQREKHPSIELSDQEHLEKMHPNLKHKFQEARSFVINSIEAPKIEMPIDPDILSKYKIKDKGVKNEKSKSKASKGKPKKANPKPNKSAMAKI